MARWGGIWREALWLCSLPAACWWTVAELGCATGGIGRQINDGVLSAGAAIWSFGSLSMRCQVVRSWVEVDVVLDVVLVRYLSVRARSPCRRCFIDLSVRCGCVNSIAVTVVVVGMYLSGGACGRRTRHPGLSACCCVFML
eukprot:5875044-Amphidinium_carterae.2